MVGYVAKNNPVYAIVTDYVSAPLTQFVRDLAKQHSTLPVVDTKCGYACRYVHMPPLLLMCANA
jgi:leucyl aminopeptidase